MAFSTAEDAEGRSVIPSQFLAHFYELSFALVTLPLAVTKYLAKATKGMKNLFGSHLRGVQSIMVGKGQQ